ncbi:hypothetical protein HF520_09945 [Romboutsia sp. CE17]|uniref:hypothetical protein n=1 Tax=Romboutsia sp. CE17 TaxID=2724150 RepID=UPI001442C9C1|nr:hypothetical protein [Romboutsia sp. CE17]QJA07519.1 hypothetical protein HF520_00500 [Romboutsia sp. CE17]QJA08757.1 hypothetical protein HF520_07270 [Romboutsia sp. CE17]QJA08862.1 hypothetical protein HF520_07840 [Romboutsia sp. CE17]QJA09258.1 hypothetical protein HF520_09945 [Romboutsia sp. CE17]
MRKYILISCICACILSLIVGLENIDSNKSDVDESTKVEAQNENVIDFYENPVLVDNEDLKISAVNLHYKDNAGMIELIIENKSDELISVNLDKLFFSDKERDAHLSCNINSNSSANEYIYIESITSINDFHDKIEGTLNVLMNKNNNQYEFMFKG